MLETQNQHFVRDFSTFSQFVTSKSMFSYECFHEPQNLLRLMLRQNRCFVRGVRQFSSHLTKYHDCHGICTVSPLDVALTLRLAKNTQLDTSEDMTMRVSKVLRVPRNMQPILRKRCKSIAAATQNNFRHVRNMKKCHRVPRLPRKTKLCDVWNFQK